jgi:hypothetical protein
MSENELRQYSSYYSGNLSDDVTSCCVLQRRQSPRQGRKRRIEFRVAEKYDCSGCEVNKLARGKRTMAVRAKAGRTTVPKVWEMGRWDDQHGRLKPCSSTVALTVLSGRIFLILQKSKGHSFLCALALSFIAAL